jgi:N-acetylneuraminic acid mutarotase
LLPHQYQNHIGLLPLQCLIPDPKLLAPFLNNKICIIGGFENGHSTSSVEVYDPVADKWSNIASLSQPLDQPLDHSTATSYNGKLYVVGGGYLDRNVLSNKQSVHL